MKKILWLIVLIAIGIQFAPKNLPENSIDTPNDLLTNVEVPEEVAELLQTSCYDCHSNQTKYPWYSYVAPVSWWISKDIREGREELNFSLWKSLETTEKAAYLEDIIDVISDGTMPIEAYAITHTDAKLTEEEQELLINWVNSYGEQLFDF